MIETRMTLGSDELAILRGEKGDTLRKAMEAVVLYGETFGAKKLVPIDGAIHLVMSAGVPLLKPVYDLMDELIAAGLKTGRPFTANPRPVDFKNIPAGPLKRLVYRIMFGRQRTYENQLARVGHKDSNAYTCACYLDEVGNIPGEGDMLSWAESSAVAYVNSVIGARTNRNSSGIELLCGIVGKAPLFGFLTDEGRRADWLVDLRTTKKPEAQILGSAIGMKVMADVPFIRGLDRFLGSTIDTPARDYFKDMGAAAASNGAVGLFHAENLTPEAKKQGASLLKKGYKTYVVDDAELDRVHRGYPLMWKRADARPKICFIGCPHLSRTQLNEWLERFESALKERGRKKVGVRTVLLSAPDIVSAFKADTAAYARFRRAGLTLSSICPLMYTNNPICAKEPIITCSNKLRTYSNARYFTERDILGIAVTGRLS
jgi:predicted aconitase